MSYFLMFVAVSNIFHGYSDGVLVVHPTLPYVLSAYGREMKLWDWDKGWECIQTFELKHYDSIGEVAFSPTGTNNFATASSDCIIKV
jgi:coatomer subunit beta'